MIVTLNLAGLPELTALAPFVLTPQSRGDPWVSLKLIKTTHRPPLGAQLYLSR